MRSRQDLVEIFSTFIDFQADCFSSWKIDSRLRESMQNRLKNLSLLSPKEEKFWVLYWHKIWQEQPQSLAILHLSSYLQEVCYWAAQKTLKDFVSSQYSLADCFQIGIVQVEKVLQGFNPQQNFNLKNYASIIFVNSIKEDLRQHHEVDICTDWALLRKLSQKKLKEALANSGLPSATIASYLLAWNCFKITYIPAQASNTRQLPKPKSEDWQTIAKLYNLERLVRLDPAGDALDAETIALMMSSCVKAARAYFYPTITSIDTSVSEQNYSEKIEGLLQIEPPLDKLLEIEEETNRQLQQAQINAVLVAALAKLEPQARQLLHLYYAQSLTQNQIASRMNLKQYTVSRHLAKSREFLLKELAQWSQNSLHIFLTSDVLKNISTTLDEWLYAQLTNTEIDSF
jgi:RNA polymerase sigma factor (sigma-70 family)